MKTVAKIYSGSVTILGFATLLTLFVGQRPAKADEIHRLEIRVESDRKILRIDEDRLHRLEFKLDDATKIHDWHVARDTRKEIDHTRDNIALDRVTLQHDIDRLHHEHSHDHDRDNYHLHE